MVREQTEAQKEITAAAYANNIAAVSAANTANAAAAIAIRAHVPSPAQVQPPPLKSPMSYGDDLLHRQSATVAPVQGEMPLPAPVVGPVTSSAMAAMAAGPMNTHLMQAPAAQTETCVNEHEECEAWALTGECDQARHAHPADPALAPAPHRCASPCAEPWLHARVVQQGVRPVQEANSQGQPSS